MVLDESYRRLSESPNGTVSCEVSCMAGCQVRRQERCTKECNLKCAKAANYHGALGLALSRFEIMGHDLDRLSSKLPQRRLLSFVNSIASFVSDVRNVITSVTLIKLLLSHVPYVWDKHYGTDDIGSTARLRVINSAFFKLGLFEGGMGVDLYDYASVSVKAWPLSLNIFRAGLSFEAGALYTTPISGDLIPAVTQNLPHTLQTLTAVFLNGPAIIWELLLLLQSWSESLHEVKTGLGYTRDGLQWLALQMEAFKSGRMNGVAFVQGLRRGLQSVPLDYFWGKLNEISGVTNLLVKFQVQERIDEVEGLLETGLEYVKNVTEILEDFQVEVKAWQEDVSTLIDAVSFTQLGMKQTQIFSSVATRLSVAVQHGSLQDILSPEEYKSIATAGNVLGAASATWPVPLRCTVGQPDLLLGESLQCFPGISTSLMAPNLRDGSCVSGYFKEALPHSFAVNHNKVPIQDLVPACGNAEYSACCAALQKHLTNCTATTDGIHREFESCLAKNQLDTEPATAFLSAPSNVFAMFQRAHCACRPFASQQQEEMPSLTTGECAAGTRKTDAEAPWRITDVAFWCMNHELFQTLRDFSIKLAKKCCSVLDAAYNNCTLNKSKSEGLFENCLLRHNLKTGPVEMLKKLSPTVLYASAQRQSCSCLQNRNYSPVDETPEAASSVGFALPKCLQHYPLRQTGKKSIVIVRSQKANGKILGQIYVDDQAVGTTEEGDVVGHIAAGIYTSTLVHDEAIQQHVVQINHGGKLFTIRSTVHEDNTYSANILLVRSAGYTSPDSSFDHQVSAATYTRMLALLAAATGENIQVHILDCLQISDYVISLETFAQGNQVAASSGSEAVHLMQDPWNKFVQQANKLLSGDKKSSQPDDDGTQFLGWWGEVEVFQDSIRKNLLEVKVNANLHVRVQLPVSLLPQEEKAREFVSYSNRILGKQLALQNHDIWLVENSVALISGTAETLSLLVDTFKHGSKEEWVAQLTLASEAVAEYLQQSDYTMLAARIVHQEATTGESLSSSLQAMQAVSKKYAAFKNFTKIWMNDVGNLDGVHLGVLQEMLIELDQSVTRFEVIVNESIVASKQQAREVLQAAVDHATDAALREATEFAASLANVTVDTDDIFGEGVFGAMDLLDIIANTCKKLFSPNMMSVGSLADNLLSVTKDLAQPAIEDMKTSFYDLTDDMDELKEDISNMLSTAQEEKKKADKVLEISAQVLTYLPGDSAKAVSNVAAEVKELSREMDSIAGAVGDILSYDMSDLFSPLIEELIGSLEGMATTIEEDIMDAAATVDDTMLGICENSLGRELRKLPAAAQEAAGKVLTQIDSKIDNVKTEVLKYIAKTKDMHQKIESSVRLIQFEPGFRAATAARSTLAKKLQDWQVLLSSAELKALTQHDWQSFLSVSDAEKSLAGRMKVLYSALTSTLSVSVLPGITPTNNLVQEVQAAVESLEHMKSFLSLGSTMLTSVSDALPHVVGAELEAKSALALSNLLKMQEYAWATHSKSSSFAAAFTQACMEPSLAFSSLPRGSSDFFTRVCGVYAGNKAELAHEAFLHFESVVYPVQQLFGRNDTIVAIIQETLKNVVLNQLYLEPFNSLGEVLQQLPHSHLKQLASNLCLYGHSQGYDISTPLGGNEALESQCNIRFSAQHSQMQFVQDIYQATIQPHCTSEDECALLRLLDIMQLSTLSLGGNGFLHNLATICSMLSGPQSSKKMKLSKLLLAELCAFDSFQETCGLAGDSSNGPCNMEEPPLRVFSPLEGEELVLVERLTQQGSYIHTDRRAFDPSQVSDKSHIEALARLCQAAAALGGGEEDEGLLKADVFELPQSKMLTVVLHGGGSCHNVSAYGEWMAEHVVRGVTSGAGRVRLTEDIPWLFDGWQTTTPSCPTAADYFDFAQRVALHLFENYRGYKVTFTGHALGGALATLSGLHCVEHMGADSCSVLTFSSPGVADLLAHMPLSEKTAHSMSQLSVETYVLDGDLVPFSGWHFGTVCILQDTDSQDCFAAGLMECLSRASASHNLSHVVAATALMAGSSSMSCATFPNGQTYSLFDHFLQALQKGGDVLYKISKESAMQMNLEILVESGAVLHENFGEMIDKHIPKGSEQVTTGDMLARAIWPVGLVSLDILAVNAPSFILRDLKATLQDIGNVADAAHGLLHAVLYFSGTLTDDAKNAQETLAGLESAWSSVKRLVPRIPEVPQKVADAAHWASFHLESAANFSIAIMQHIEDASQILEDAVEVVGNTFGGKHRPKEDKSCGQDVCISTHQRSLDSYRLWVFPLQYTRFWDLSSPPLLNVEKRKQSFILPGESFVLKMHFLRTNAVCSYDSHCCDCHSLHSKVHLLSQLS